MVLVFWISFAEIGSIGEMGGKCRQGQTIAECPVSSVQSWGGSEEMDGPL